MRISLIEHQRQMGLKSFHALNMRPSKDVELPHCARLHVSLRLQVANNVKEPLFQCGTPVRIAIEKHGRQLFLVVKLNI